MKTHPTVANVIRRYFSDFVSRNREVVEKIKSQRPNGHPSVTRPCQAHAHAALAFSVALS